MQSLRGSQPSGSVAFELFSVSWGFPFSPLKAKLLAGDLRAALELVLLVFQKDWEKGHGPVKTWERLSL